MLDWIAEEPDNRDTADGRPATRAAAEARLAPWNAWTWRRAPRKREKSSSIGRYLNLLQSFQMALQQNARRLPGPLRKVVVAGEGAFLTLHCLKMQTAIPPCPTVRLHETLGPDVSRAACAHAVAVLSAEE